MFRLVCEGVLVLCVWESWEYDTLPWSPHLLEQSGEICSNNNNQCERAVTPSYSELAELEYESSKSNNKHIFELLQRMRPPARDK